MRMSEPTLSSVLSPLFFTEAATTGEKHVPVVFCDMDGVVADFNAAMKRFYNLQTRKDIIQFLEQPGIWKRIGKEHPNLFAELPLTKDARRLMNGLFRYKDLGYIRLAMLTALPKEWFGDPLMKERGTADKKYWMAKNFPEMDEHHVIVVTRDQKVEMAIKQRATQRRPPVLIDDYSRNIKEWQRKGNGIGILHTDAQKSLSDLWQYLYAAEQDDFQLNPNFPYGSKTDVRKSRQP